MTDQRFDDHGQSFSSTEKIRGDEVDDDVHRDHGGHSGWMMMICCIPMLLIAGALVLTGVAGAGTVIVAIVCTLMMYMMMRGMDHGAR